LAERSQGSWAQLVAVGVASVAEMLLLMGLVVPTEETQRRQSATDGMV